MESWIVDLLNWVTGWLLRFLSRRRSLSPPAGWAIGTCQPASRGSDPEPVSLPETELDRHLYVLGASGSGKSRLLELLVRQHLQQDAGFCLIDPHGDLTRSVAGFLLEEYARSVAGGKPLDLDRVYLVEPFREDGLVGLNPLDPGGGPLYPHIGELVGIFRRFWAGSWGPRMEELLRNTLLALALADLTLTEAIPFLTDGEFRARTLDRVRDGEVKAYWNDRFDPLSDAARATMAEPALNKLGALLADPRVRGMLGQQRGDLDLRRLMDGGAWILLNCSKGQLRDASYLLGSLLVAKLQAAAMSRAECPERDRRRFTLLIDEFQNFRGEDMETILCEARKYRLRMVLAHQHLGQLDDALQQAIWGNVGTLAVFAVSPQDAAVVGRRLDDRPSLIQALGQQPVGHALLCRRGQPPSRTRILPVFPAESEEPALDEFMGVLRARHGRSLRAVEAEIRKRLSPARAARPRGTGAGPGKPGRRKAVSPGPDIPAPGPPGGAAGAVREADDD